jgi:Zn-dependent protease with chaperone function
MLRVNGLYGHMQRNNAKAVVLIVTLLGLFLVVQFSVRTVYFLQMAQAEANGMVLEPVRDSDPLVTRLFGVQVEKREPFHHRLTVLRGEEAPTEADREANRPAPAGPNRNATLIDAFRLMVARTQYLGLQCLALLLLALVFIGNSARRTGLLMRYATRARPLERGEYPELYNLVENLALTAGLPCPAIELIESDKLNAYATGLTPASARLGLTTGLIHTLDRRELEAVIAHEITHIQNGDTKLMAVTKACADLVVEQPRRMWQALSGMRRPRYVPLILFTPFLILFVLPPILVTVVLAPIVYVIMLGIPALMAVGGLVCKAMMHHSREFVADAGAIELTKNSAALVSALCKMAGLNAQLTTNLTAQAMMFSGSDGGWLSTHPTLTARIEAITMHGGMLGKVHVTQPRVAVAPQRPGQAPTFGRRGQPQGIGRAPRLSGSMAQRSFAHKSTPHAVWDDKLPPPPSRGDAWSSGTPRPTVWEQIQMEGWDDYLKKRPLLYVPFFIAAALLLPVLARLTAALGFH